MKKILIFAVVATMFAACSKDATQDATIATPIDKFYATIADDASRVQLDAECKTVWTAGDQLSVFNKTTGNECWQFGGATGDTKGELTKVSGTAGEPLDKVVALYPYDAENVIDNGTIHTVIPATQKYMKNSFGEGGNLMIAMGNDADLAFKHLLGWIRIALTGDQAVKSVTLRAYNNEPLAGNATIGDDLGVTINGNASKTVTLDCGEGVQLTSEPTYFYIAVVPQAFARGFGAEITYSGDKTTGLATNNSVTVERNHIVPMNAAECKPLTAPLPNQLWYTTSDGKTVTPKSYEGSIISNTYSDGRGVITFDCAQKTIAAKAFYFYTTLTGITIPEGVGEICDEALSCCLNLASVTIPASVTKIGKEVFCFCKNIKGIRLPEGITSIDERTFSGCRGLASITIPDSVTSIGEYAFSDCSALTSITLTDNITEIGSWAFGYCTNLASVTIPDSVTALGGEAFSGCTGLSAFYGKFASSDNRCLVIDGALTVFAPAGLTTYDIPTDIKKIGAFAFNKCKNLISVKIHNGVTSIGMNAFYCCTGLAEITLPEGLDSISPYVFNGCSALAAITIPDGVASIGEGAFMSCTGLKSVHIGTGVTSIGEAAFNDCSALTSITIPDNVTSIGEFGFQKCTDMKSVTIGKNITSLASCLFAGCSTLAAITIPDGVTSIGKETFKNCTALKNVTVPDGVTSLGECAFEGCSGLESITLGKGISSIGDYAFKGCRGKLYINSYGIPNTGDPFVQSEFTDVIIGDNVTAIYGLAFYNCTGIANIVVGDNVTKIGNYTFRDCTGLKSVTIGKSVTAIDYGAFIRCSSLVKVYCKPTTPPTLGGNAFTDNPSDAKIYVPRASVDAYKAAENWKDYASRIEGCDF